MMLLVKFLPMKVYLSSAFASAKNLARSRNLFSLGFNLVNNVYDLTIFTMALKIGGFAMVINICTQKQRR